MTSSTCPRIKVHIPQDFQKLSPFVFYPSGFENLEGALDLCNLTNSGISLLASRCLVSSVNTDVKRLTAHVDDS